MKLIPLTQGKFVKVDDEDYEYLNQWKWQAAKGARTYYAVRTDYSSTKKKIYLHKILIDSEYVDHKDTDGLNCQKNNLRPCTKTENNRNKKASGLSQYLGVSFKRETKKWVARIMVNGKAIHLGYFNTDKEAAIAYDKAAIVHFGEFANLNSKILTLKY